MLTPTTRRASSRELRVRSTRLRQRGDCSAVCRSGTGARCRCERPWSLAAFGSAPFPSSFQCVLPPLAIACRQTIAASSTCRTLQNCPRPDALRGIDVYIGDGATVKRSMVRRRGSEWVEHAPIARQLDWCAKAHVRPAVFTHCGSPIERATTHAIDSLVARLGQEHGLNVRIACDGDRLSPRPLSGAIGART